MKGNWKKNEKNNLTIALNVLYTKKENTCPAYVPKHSSNRDDLNREKWHSLQ